MWCVLRVCRMFAATRPLHTETYKKNSSHERTSSCSRPCRECTQTLQSPPSLPNKEINRNNTTPWERSKPTFYFHWPNQTDKQSLGVSLRFWHCRALAALQQCLDKNWELLLDASCARRLILRRCRSKHICDHTCSLTCVRAWVEQERTLFLHNGRAKRWWQIFPSSKNATEGIKSGEQRKEDGGGKKTQHGSGCR